MNNSIDIKSEQAILDKWICAFSYFNIAFLIFACFTLFIISNKTDIQFKYLLFVFVYTSIIDPIITYYFAYKRRNQFFILFTIIKLSILPILSYFTVIIAMANPIILLLYLILLLVDIYYLVSCRQLYKISNFKNDK